MAGSLSQPDGARNSLAIGAALSLETLWQAFESVLSVPFENSDYELKAGQKEYDP
jgi:hypothetical protein